MLNKGVVIFLGDVLIYSTMVEEHFNLLEKVCACLCKYKFYCKLKKCSFLQRTTTFLGFDITLKGLQISDAKVQSLKMAEANYHIIGTVIFRFCIFFLKFIKGFSTISEPLHALTWKDAGFVWGES